MSLKVISIVGRSGSGKTTLITKLIPYFTELGLKVGSIKHTHHNVTFDKPGKDSWKHREAGSSQVLLVTGKKMALFSDLPESFTLNQMAERWFSEFDVVISEGFKNENCFKIEVSRESNNKEPLYLTPSYQIQALICDFPKQSEKIPIFPLHEPRLLFNWIVKELDIKQKDN